MVSILADAASVLERFREECRNRLPQLRHLHFWVDDLPAYERIEMLVSLIAEHLQQSWELGRGVRLDGYAAEYGGEFPALASPATLPADLIEAEFLARYANRTGDFPKPEEYRSRFGDRSDVLELIEGRLVDGERYVKLRRRGQGGLGQVWEAYDRNLRRRVAIKEPRGRLSDSDGITRSLANEATVTAGLDHQAIVPVHEYRHNQQEPPFYVMRLVEGRTLREAVRDYHMTSRHPAKRHLLWSQLLQSFSTICDAVAYAHTQGVIHGDLKPENVKLGPFGETILLDWGLAKRVAITVSSSLSEQSDEYSQRDADTRTHCGDGQPAHSKMAGTLPYMAPEQVDGWVDMRTDVFGLGAILCELLTGKPPYEPVDTENDVATQQLLLLVKKGDLAQAHVRLDACGADAELLTLARSCLEVKPVQRPQDGSQVAQRIKDYLASVQERLRQAELKRRTRWFRRALWGALVLVLFGVFYLVKQHQVLSAESLARDSAEKAEAREQGLLYFNRILLAHTRWRENNVAEMQRLLDACPEHLRGWEWDYLERLAHADLQTLSSHSGYVWGVAFSWDGRRLASTSGTEAKLWDRATGQLLVTLKGHTGEITSVAFSPDGRSLVSAAADKTVRVWDAAKGKEILSLSGIQKPIRGAIFSPDARLIAGDEAGGVFIGEGKPAPVRVTVWDAATGQPVRSFPTATSWTHDLAFSPDSKRLATANAGGSVQVWYVQSGQPAFPPLIHLARGEGQMERAAGDLPVIDLKHTHDVLGVAFSPDGTLLASAGGDWKVKLWNATTGLLVDSLQGHIGFVSTVAFSPNSKRLVSGCEDGTVKVWNVQSGNEIMSLQGHTAPILCVSFSPDGQRLATGSEDETVKVWDPQISPEAQALHGHSQWVSALVFSSDGRRLASGGSSIEMKGEKARVAPAEIKVWDMTIGREALSLRSAAMQVTGLAFSQDSTRLAATVGEMEEPGEFRVWDTTSGNTVLARTKPIGAFALVAFSPNFPQLATTQGENYDPREGAGTPGTLKLYNLPADEEVTILRGHPAPLRSLAYSADGTILAAASYRCTGAIAPVEIKVLDVATGKERQTLKGHTDTVMSLAFSPEGTRLASASEDKTVRVWDIVTGEQLHILRGHTDKVHSVVFSPDGKRLASAGEDYTVKLWDPITGLEALSLHGHTRTVLSLAFSPDGKQLASGGQDQIIKIWSATTAKTRAK